jgi:hypothetical protein
MLLFLIHIRCYSYYNDNCYNYYYNDLNYYLIINYYLSVKLCEIYVKI